MLCPIIRVTVTRAAIEQIPTDCFAHELSILAEIHGEDNVVVTSDEPLMNKPLRPQEEYGRLVKKYGLVPEEKYTYVEYIYGPASSGRLRDTMAKGMQAVTDMTEQDVHDIEDEEDAPAPVGPEAGSYPWIKQQLRVYAVDFAGNAKKADLELLLRTEYCERLGKEWDEVKEAPLGYLDELLLAANPTE